MNFELENFYAAIKKEKDPDILGEGVCSETRHYLTVFQRGQLVNWNWVAFLFGPIWMLYRRLYAPYVLLMLISIALAYIPTMFLLMGLLINIAVGVFSDSIYIYFVKQEHLRGLTLNPENIPLVVLISAHLIVAVTLSNSLFYLESEPVDQITDMFNDA